MVANVREQADDVFWTRFSDFSAFFMGSCNFLGYYGFAYGFRPGFASINRWTTRKSFRRRSFRDQRSLEKTALFRQVVVCIAQIASNLNPHFSVSRGQNPFLHGGVARNLPAFFAFSSENPPISLCRSRSGFPGHNQTPASLNPHNLFGFIFIYICTTQNPYSLTLNWFSRYNLHWLIVKGREPHISPS